ncbi:chondroitinase-B domain-containing protein [Neotamlana laminarinivorans]|uniref:T9SS type A sorting domain-containing protein n=1 Tax=Neotamlana laminarinivorans TaxID=2883124 RepID=A0A9X1HXI2_9FLAO|nr:chondroitinase-B domain-containing protein [Tamlana laminarinivorans]MCB4797391.1 T9SS type A sorting domain-containing protein [Tamlana laminarinivorans]
MRKLNYIVLLLCSIISYAQSTYNINNPEDLETLTLVAGDEVILANGTYTTDERIIFNGSGTSTNPITFRAESPGGVNFTGGLKINISGEYLVVDGFYWKGGEGANNHIQFRNGTNYAINCTIQNCAIDGLEPEPDDPTTTDEDESTSKHRWIVLYGQYNTVLNCSFLNKRSPGALVLVELSYNYANADGIVGHNISNNYFYNFEKRDSETTNAGDSETIRIGASSYQAVNANVSVEGNYFNKADGENEIITNKSANNIYRNNTFRACRGSLVLRHGASATIDSNYFLGENVEGTGAIRISDSYHTIINNYIQDVINVDAQAQWNNGITFLGGSESSGGTSNGYQITQDVFIAHNTFYNVNAPLYFNDSKGSTDPTGTFINNLFYTTQTNIISGAFSTLGSGLNFQNNLYQGTNLGATLNASEFSTGVFGFTQDDEIYIPSETGSAANTAITTSPIVSFDIKGLTRSSSEKDVGANEVSGATGNVIFSPHTDAMVGNGIGSCFIGAGGTLLTNTNCTIANISSLYFTNLETFSINGGTQNTEVTSNINWTVTPSDSWISLSTTSGSGSATISITVSENTTTSERQGTITFNEVNGSLSRVLSVSQTAPLITDLYNLINTGEIDDPVTINSFSKEEVNGTTKFNYAANTLDKNFNTVWAADDGDLISGDYKGDGEYIIYDLGDEYSLDIIRYATTNKTDAFGYQVWVSTSGSTEAEFSMIIPTSGDLQLTETNTTEFNTYHVNATARYVKIVGFGRFNTTGTTRESVWCALSEIEFFGQSTSLTTSTVSNKNTISLYPNPITNNVFYFYKNNLELDTLNVYDVSGKLTIKKALNTSNNIETIDTSSLAKGLYFVEIKGKNFKSLNKIIVN